MKTKPANCRNYDGRNKGGCMSEICDHMKDEQRPKIWYSSKARGTGGQQGCEFWYSSRTHVAEVSTQNRRLAGTCRSQNDRLEPYRRTAAIPSAVRGRCCAPVPHWHILCRNDWLVRFRIQESFGSQNPHKISHVNIRVANTSACLRTN